ncbi:hypothetical protein KCV05_g17028, partial [Aureobasidium melanogenum]
LSDGSRSTVVLAAQAFATTLSNGQTTTSYGSYLPVSSSVLDYAALSGSSGISSAAAALSSQDADISSRLSSLNAAASTATGSARSSYSSEAVVLQSSASSALRSANSALSSAASRVSSEDSTASAATSRVSSEISTASAAASSSADNSLPSSSASQGSGTSVVGSSATATAPGSTSTATLTNDGSNNTPPPSVLAGGIVGGVAGLAVLVLIAMIFLRWYRKRMANMNALTEAEAATGSGGARGMSERGRTAPVLAPLLGGVFKNRKSRAAEDTGERGFQRISGRKLPSAFSAGMTSGPPMLMPSAFDNDRNMSTTSVYRDSTYYGAAGSPFDDPENEIGTNETINPGPARQARIHHPYTMSPTSAMSENASPTSPTFPIQGHRLTPEPGQNAPLMTPLNPQTRAHRSVTPATLSSFDGSRGSRFTEEV